MIWLLANWKWLTSTAVAAALAVTLGFTKIELADLRAADATALAKATEAARAKDAENQTIAAEVEKAHAERSKAIDDAYDANQQLAHARGLFVHVKSCGVSKPSASSNGASNGAIKAQLSTGDGDFLTAFARDCARDQNIAVTGHDWAGKVGAK